MRKFLLTAMNRKMIMDRPNAVLQKPALFAGANDRLS